MLRNQDRNVEAHNFSMEVGRILFQIAPGGPASVRALGANLWRVGSRGQLAAAKTRGPIRARAREANLS